MKKKMIALGILVLMAGCATGAQQESARMRAAVASTNDQAKQCQVRAEQSPEWQELSAYLPSLDGSDPSMTLRTNASVPTPEQAATLARLFNDYMRPCQATLLASTGAVHPAMSAVLAESYAARNQAYAQLASRQATWGAYANFSASLVAETKSAWARTGQEIEGGLQAQHNTEVQQRQAASAAMMQTGMGLMALSNQQQMINQNQQAIYAANRPRTSNCQVIAGFLQCTTF